MRKDNNLKLCPFCGGHDLKYVWDLESFQVVCSCGASGPISKVVRDTDADFYDAMNIAKNRAAEAWNCRPWIGSLYQDELERLENAGS